MKLTKIIINQQAVQPACINQKNMAIKSGTYVFVKGMHNVYLAKITKSGCVSLNRRIVTDSEIIGMFEFYLRRWVDQNGRKTVTITNSKGVVFEATLLSE